MLVVVKWDLVRCCFSSRELLGSFQISYLYNFYKNRNIKPSWRGKQVVVFGSAHLILYHKVSAAWKGLLLHIPILSDISAIPSLILRHFHRTKCAIIHPSSSSLQQLQRYVVSGIGWEMCMPDKSIRGCVCTLALHLHFWSKLRAKWLK